MKLTKKKRYQTPAHLLLLSQPEKGSQLPSLQFTQEKQTVLVTGWKRDLWEVLKTAEKVHGLLIKETNDRVCRWEE